VSPDKRLDLDPKFPHHQGTKTPRNGMAGKDEEPDKPDAHGALGVLAVEDLTREEEGTWRAGNGGEMGRGNSA
jgi:hypothetical protein